MAANGNSIEFMMSNGTTHDVKFVPDLIDCLNLEEEETEILCADNGYDSEFLREKIKATKIKANIPKTYDSQSSYSWEYIYKIKII